MRRLPLALLLLASALAVPVREPLPVRLTNWPAGVSGDLRLTSGDLTLSTPVGPEGQFTLSPPTPEQVAPALRRILSFFTAPTLGAGCVGKGAAVPTNGQYAAFELRARPEGRTEAVVVPTTSPGQPFQTGEVRAALLYLTRPTTLRGTVTCPDAVYRVAGTYHAGLVLVPLVYSGRDEAGRPIWTFDDMRSLKGLSWPLEEPRP